MAAGKRIGIVGFGYIGSVIGAVLASRGHHVVGIEPDLRRRQLVAAGKAPVPEPGLDELVGSAVAAGLLEITDDRSALSDVDVVLITVGTPLDDDNDADTSQLIEAAEAIAPHLRDGQLILLKSTVPPGTTQLVAPVVRRHAATLVAFSPERLAEGRAIAEFQTIPIVVGGVDEESTQAGVAFWHEVLDVEVIQVSSSMGAELVKLADNLWIDLNIALGNELAQLCDRLGGIDVLEVISAANSLPKVQHHVNILTPSIGVGGYCLTKDPWFVHSMGKSLGLDLQTPRISREVNDGMAQYSAASIDDAVGGVAASPRLAILGVAFKTDTGDVRYTPTLPVMRELEKLGYQLVAFDPFVDKRELDEQEQARGLHLEWVESADEALAGADAVAFFTGHRQFAELTPAWLAQRLPANAVVFDGRRYFTRKEIDDIEARGLRYKGIGR
jgi:UDP-N-acetyl-D-mannosaminuronic acid dehydrogenase